MRRWIRLIGIVPLVGLIFGVGFLAGSSHPMLTAQAQSGQPADTDKLFEPFWEAWSAVHEKYVDPIDDDALMQGAITGMVAALGDPHSAYMDQQLFESLNNELNGRLEGIGATVKKDNATGGLVIVTTIKGAPAREAGLQPGDVVVTVDGKDITSLSELQIIGKVRGPAGTQVKLGLIRKGQKNIVELTITRARIEVSNVTTALYAGNIGYIKLAEFTDTATRDFAKGLQELNANKLNGLVLDLRDDPGGFLQTAINIASQFVKSGPLVIERGRPGSKDVIFRSTGKTLAPDVPLVILVNGGSASASELVSGALHDRGRAIIIGEKSFGKGSVQEFSTLSNGGGLRVTIAHFFTSTGRVINQIGLTPDIVVPWNVDANPDFDVQLAEAIRYLQNEF
jgi:carboxyl-terminal processing protease